MTDDSPLFAEDFRWKLSQIRQCVPLGTDFHMPDKLDSESLLMLDIVQTEYQRDEWQRIAESYRMIAEVTIEALALAEDQNRKLRALAKNQGEELILRKSR